METFVLLSLLLAFGCMTINGAPVEHGGIEPGSCEDASTKGAAELALTKINLDRKEGYIFGLHRLSNAHLKKHGENGVVFYLTLDVVETNCSVLSKKDWKSCDIRPHVFTKVYGQCKAAIFINKVQRVVRLYKYNCAVRPGGMPAGCGGCLALTGHDDVGVQKAVSKSLEKFNKESGLAKRFGLLQISHATAQVVAGRIYRVEYTIQETTCPHNAEAVTAERCPLMDCEFAHKGFCKATHTWLISTGEENIEVDCEIYEPEAAEREKKLHLLGGETDHSHHDAHSHGQDRTDAADQIQLAPGHNHSHLHEHEHHHHQLGHEQETAPHNRLQGMVTRLIELGRPVTQPSLPDVPAGDPVVGLIFPLRPDPQIPGQMEPTIEAFPTSVSAQCPTTNGKYQEVEELFAKDPTFKSAA